jgi:hypothetical protein
VRLSVASTWFFFLHGLPWPQTRCKRLQTPVFQFDFMMLFSSLQTKFGHKPFISYHAWYGAGHNAPRQRVPSASRRRSKGVSAHQASRRTSLAFLIGTASFLGYQNEASMLSWAASDTDLGTIAMKEVDRNELLAPTWRRPATIDCHTIPNKKLPHGIHSYHPLARRKQLSRLMPTVISTRLFDC